MSAAKARRDATSSLRSCATAARSGPNRTSDWNRTTRSNTISDWPPGPGSRWRWSAAQVASRVSAMEPAAASSSRKRNERREMNRHAVQAGPHLAGIQRQPAGPQNRSRLTRAPAQDGTQPGQEAQRPARSARRATPQRASPGHQRRGRSAVWSGPIDRKNRLGSANVTEISLGRGPHTRRGNSKTLSSAMKMPAPGCSPSGALVAPRAHRQLITQGHARAF